MVGKFHDTVQLKLEAIRVQLRKTNCPKKNKNDGYSLWYQ